MTTGQLGDALAAYGNSNTLQKSSYATWQMIKCHLLNNDFSEAKHELKKAFQLCHRDQHQNKQRILRYLVPVEMTYGKFPTPKMLEQYDLTEYQEVIDACLSGNMVALEDSLEKNCEQFINSGVFTVIEKLRMMTLRNFIKKVTQAINATPVLQLHGKQNHVNLQLLYRPLQKWDPELDLDELECLIANLMGSGLLRGYISHERRILVLSKDAFASD